MSLGYCRSKLRELSSATTAVRIHIVCIHMAMAVMRIALNIVLCFYSTATCSVKPIAEKSASLARLLARPTGVPGQSADDSTGDFAMKICWILALLCCSIPTFAVRGGMEKATVHAMRKVPCTESQSTGRNGFLSGLAGSSGSGSSECIEYELRTEKVSYIIRPHRAILLLLGGDVSIKLADNELLLRTSQSVKDIRCAVLAMSLRSEAEIKDRERERSRPAPTRCHTESGREILCPDEP
jgi:hypothetical protein